MAAVIGAQITSGEGYLVTADYDDVTGVITRIVFTNNTGLKHTFTFTRNGRDFVTQLPPGQTIWNPPNVPGGIKWLTDALVFTVN